jgi:hypothetical protein
MSQLEWSHSGRSQRNSAPANGDPRAWGHRSRSSGLSGAPRGTRNRGHRGSRGRRGSRVTHSPPALGRLRRRLRRHQSPLPQIARFPPELPNFSLPLCISLSAALPNEITFDIPGNSTILIAKSSRAILSSLRFGHRFEVIIACANRTVPAVTAHARLLAANKASESRLQPSSQPQVSRTMHMRSDRRHV